jgi:integrase
VKISKSGLGEVKLSVDQTDRILELAESNARDHLLLGLELKRGLRIGAIVGSPPKTTSWTLQRDGPRGKKGDRVSKTYSQPGLRREDVSEDGLMLHLKGGATRLIYPGAELLRETLEYAKTVSPGDRLIQISEWHATRIMIKYAKLAGVPMAERLHNHRARHHFGTQWARKTGRDSWKVKSLLGHASPGTTAIYVDDLTVEEEKELLDSAERQT